VAGVDEVGVLKIWTGEDPSDIGFNILTDDSALVGNASKWIVVGPENIQNNEIGTTLDPYTNIFVTNVFSDSAEMGEVFIGNGTLATPVSGTVINDTGFIPYPDSTNNTTGVKLGLSTNRFREGHIRNIFTYGKFGIGDFTTNKNAKLLADTVQDYTIIPDPAQLVNLGASGASKRFNSMYAITFNGTNLVLGTGTGEGVSSDLVASTDNTYDVGSTSRYFAESYINQSTVQSILTKSATATIGTNVNRFQTIYATTFDGTATQAKYADLAERFEADKEYIPGTLVKIGGTKEVTATTKECDTDVFGVISTDPAYMMNSEAGSDETHPYVAWCGRVPVRVVGKVKKGQRLVSSNINGVAKAATGMEGWQCVFGRALVNKDDDGEGLILVAVGAK
jgi:hypothetical protein